MAEPAPLKLYVGRKGYDAEGNKITSDHSERDQFLGRNGMLWGQLYGQTLKTSTLKNWASLPMKTAMVALTTT